MKREIIKTAASQKLAQVKNAAPREKTAAERFVQDLLLVMPNWHSKLVKPFRESLNKEMSLETYYCLETVKMCGQVTMTELSRHLRVPKQQVTKLIDKLEEHGFVERVHDQNDRRAIWICLTSKAIVYLNEYYLKSTGFIQSLEEQLTGEEISRMSEAMEVLGEMLARLK